MVRIDSHGILSKDILWTCHLLASFLCVLDSLFFVGFTGLRGLRRQEVWSNCFALGFQHLGQTEATLIEDCDVNVPRTRTSCSSEVVTWLSGLFLICFYFESTGLKMALATNWRLLLEHEIPVDVRTKENWARIIFGCLLIHPKDHWTLKTGVILRTQTTLRHTGSNPFHWRVLWILRAALWFSGSRPSNFLARMTLLHSSLLLGVAMCQYVNGCSLRRLA